MINRYLKFAAAVLLAVAVSPFIALAASFGTQNFFYAPSNVITPLPGYTTSWSSGGGAVFAYPFINSATTSPLMLLASTTIGNGNVGITISGPATTTGNAYIAGNLGVGTTTPAVKVDVRGAIVSEELGQAFSATPTFDWSTTNQIDFGSTTANVTSVTFTGGQRGGGYRLVVCQDLTGGRTIGGWGSNIIWPSHTAPTLTTTPGRCDLFPFTATYGTTSAVEYLGGSVQSY
jgi:hypothetical protein